MITELGRGGATKWRVATVWIATAALVLSACAAASTVPADDDRSSVGSSTTSPTGGASRPRAEIVHESVPFAERSGETLRLDVLRTAGAPADQPILVIMHGGSWRRRHKGLWKPFVPRIARLGYTVVMPDVRLAPPGGPHHFPAPVDDLSAAIAWLRRHGTSVGGDPGRIGLMGSSSGASVALFAAGTRRGRPDAVAVFSAPIDLAAHHRNNVLRRAIEGYIGCVPDACPDRYRAASVLTGLSGTMPPTLLVYSTEDVIPLALYRELGRRLRDAGTKLETFEVAGDYHGIQLVREVPKPLRTAMRFMERRLSSERG